jgi:hypothetical protein
MFCWIAWMYTKILGVIHKENKNLRTQYISLDEEDFRCLVGGGVLTVAHVNNRSVTKIVLKDIGFHRMDKSIEDADKGIDIRKDHNKVIV